MYCGAIEMKRLFKLVLLSVALCISFTSCTGIYSELPDVVTTNTVTVDLNKEYFTTGSVYEKGNTTEGVFHNGYWIYREVQEYSYNYKRPDGKIVTSSGNNMVRFVKLNTATGVLSSLCLDPVCNHSVGSGCIMICPSGGTPLIQGFVGDNILLTYGVRDEIFGYLNQSYVYNLTTGETKIIFAHNMADNVLTKYSSRYIFDDTYYVVMDVLDYSNTGYNPQDQQPLSNYNPETVSILCEYDFKKDTLKELFEIPVGYSLCIVSNKRFFFSSTEMDMYSCDRNGENMKKEKVLDFSPQFLCGTYAYNIDYETYEIEIYDLNTNEKHTLKNEISSTYCTIAESGIIKNDLSVMDEYKDVKANGFKELEKQYPDLNRNEITKMYDTLCRKVRCSGTTQIWKWDLNGNNPQMLFEFDKALAKIIFATDDHLYGFVYRADPNNNYEEAPYENEGRSYINLKTGEITPIPYLELIIPELVEE